MEDGQIPVSPIFHCPIDARMGGQVYSPNSADLNRKESEGKILVGVTLAGINTGTLSMHEPITGQE